MFWFVIGRIVIGIVNGKLVHMSLDNNVVIILCWLLSPWLLSPRLTATTTAQWGASHSPGWLSVPALDSGNNINLNSLSKLQDGMQPVKIRIISTLSLSKGMYIFTGTSQAKQQHANNVPCRCTQSTFLIWEWCPWKRDHTNSYYVVMPLRLYFLMENLKGMITQYEFVWSHFHGHHSQIKNVDWVHLQGTLFACCCLACEVPWNCRFLWVVTEGKLS